AGTAAAAPLEPAPVPEPDEESAAFLRAMGDARPLAGRGREVAPVAETATPPPGSELSFRELMEGTLEFAVSFSDEYLEGHVVGLDPLIMGRLRSGALSPEAHLDLHGLNAVQAFGALRDFMRGAWYRSLRVVLIVPGRGRNSPQGQAVLREKLQLWLTQEPFKRVVLAFCTARPHDGGPGSVYVLLRKFRKKGRICWERLPMDADLV
uniref:Smr/MutS family protein n=1 Tax=uncultured Desulfovibrio sp. TaxID=167968 RepID=UPI0026072BA5